MIYCHVVEIKLFCIIKLSTCKLAANDKWQKKNIVVMIKSHQYLFKLNISSYRLLKCKLNVQADGFLRFYENV